MTRGDTDIKSLTEIKIKHLNSMFSGESTYSALFLIPAFDIYLDKKLYELFVNSYIDDAGELKHLFNRPLFVLIKTDMSKEDDFDSIDRYLRNNKNFVYSYPVGTNDGSYLFMYVYECPDRFKDDYDLFLTGDYSKFSKEYKSRFEKKVSVKGEYVESPIYGVLFKTSHLKKQIESILSYKSSKGDVDSPVVLEPTQEFFGVFKPEYEIFRYKP